MRAVEVLAGGAVTGDAGVPGPAKDDMVPMCWHGSDSRFYNEVAHSYNVMGWISLTCMDTTLPLHAVRNRLPALCFCYSEEHKRRLEEHLAECIFNAFKKNGDPLFEPSMSIIKDGATPTSGEPEPEEKKPNPGPTPAPKPQPGPKP